MSSHPKRLPPKLPLSAFTQPAPPPRRLVPAGLLDSHIHLYTQHQLDTGNTAWPLTKSNVLNQPHTLDFYSQITAATDGFIFVQAEAVHDDSDVDGSKGGWDGALAEVDAVATAALAAPSPKLLAIVPWAPVQHGPAALDLYFARLAQIPSLTQLSQRDAPAGSPPNPLRLIKSVRYLLEESPPGFMSSPGFVAGLKHLATLNIAFDLTVDSVHQPDILQEVIETVIKVRDGQPAGQETVFICCHLFKPPLHDEPTTPPSKEQTAYIAALFELALFPNVYLKLSALLCSAEEDLVRGAFAEYRSMQAGPSLQQTAGATTPSSSHFGTLKRRILTFLEPALESFGDSRILVGSDWPMFRAKTISTTSEDTRDLAEEKATYAFGMAVYQSALVSIGLEGEALDSVFMGNAKAAYQL